MSAAESLPESSDPPQRDDPREVARSIASHALASSPGSALPWRWDAAVLMIGLSDLIEVCAQTEALHGHHVFDFSGRHVRVDAISLADHCAGAQACARILGRRDAVEAHFAVQRVVRYLRDAPRNDAGVLDHLGHRAWYRHVYPHSIWVDSMMMYVATAHVLGARLGDPGLQRLAREHGEVFCTHLQDHDGLFRHHRCLCRATKSVRWLRGNGWAGLSLCELVDDARHDGLRASWRALGHALLERQRPDGLWPTLLDEPNAAIDTSGCALVACALARGARLGQLPEAARDAAWNTWRGLQPWLRPSPHGLSVTGISVPTIPGPAFVYRHAPRWHDLGYGTGAVLMLAAELARGSR